MNLDYKKNSILYIALAFICSVAFGYDYSHCQKYFSLSSKKTATSNFISINHKGKQVHLMYSPTYPTGVIVKKADPFIGLYLVESKNTPKAYDLLQLDTRTLNDKNLAIISNNAIQKGSIIKRQNGFVDYARFSAPVARNGVLGNICYQIYGLGIGNDLFIEKKYIERFLNQSYPYYGDIGIRFSHASKKPLVSLIDPFLENNPFMPNDEILSINNTNIKNTYDLEWIISNLKKDSLASVKLRRDGKILSIKARVGQRYGGFLLRESFLERFGIELDNDMRILKLSSKPHRFSELRIGDRLLWINKQPIITESTKTTQQKFNNLARLLSKAKFDTQFDGLMQLLIMRDNLEIFVKL